MAQPSPVKSAAAGEVQLAALLDHGRYGAVLAELRRIFAFHFTQVAFKPVAAAFKLTLKLYAGSFPGYRACTTDYHDLFHVLEVSSATARLMDGFMLSGRSMTAWQAADLLVAALLHDSGYIQEASDREGTGAKYTRSHVVRSAAFALKEAEAFGLSPERAERVSRLIMGTDLGKRWEDFGFQDKEEGESASILAAADILGQMGDRAYLEKLLFLYHEFREAGIQGYGSAFEILEKTLGFYAGIKQRLDSTLAITAGLALAHFSCRFGLDRDLYREAIQRQMDYLQRVVADDTSNFRKKLKRLDLEKVEGERRAQA